MRSFAPPPKPHNFDVVVGPAKNAVASAVALGTAPAFADDWGRFKAILQSAQKGRCGFCEGRIGGLSYGDVEHFRPKAKVCELAEDPALWGREKYGTSVVEGRTMQSGSIQPGYWWLAYAWDNYLFSCTVCNQQWKKNLFPVTGARDRAPGQNGETALLISPFESFDPADHFIYGRQGEISGRSGRGRATVATCGLDRPSLRLLRQPTAAATHAKLDEIAAKPSDARLLEILRQLRTDGCLDRPFSGMVQAIFGQRSGCGWDKLDALIGLLACGPADR